MKITEVEAIHLRLPEVKEVADGTQDCLLVRVTTDAGITGLGEVVSCSYVARAVVEAPRSAPFRHGLARIVLGLDPEDTEEVMAAMVRGTTWFGPGGVARHAMSGIDLALWDIRGKAAGLPVRRLLHPKAVDQIPCYASVLWPERPGLVAASAAEFVRQGYRAVKYGWLPMGPDLELDVELVAAAREALGPGIELMVDAGRAWTVDQARLRLERFRPYDLTWLEEPLHPADLEGYRQLAEARAIPIAAGEAICLLEEYEALLRQGRIQVIQPDLGRVGGITWARRIAAVAEEVSAWPVPHAYGTGVMLAASAQWTAACRRPLTEFTRAPSPLARDLVRTDLTFDRGILRLGEAPGLGVELDPEVVARYRVT